MRVYITVALVVATAILASFLAVEALGIPLLTDPSDRLEGAGLIGGTITTVLLLLDVFIPVPSSIVMIANGAMFGIIGGTLLTMLGSVGGAMIGFGTGRRGHRLIRRFVSPEDQQRADILIRRWGLLAIVVTRPMPILAETIAIMAGSTGMGWRRMLAGSTLGALPPALVYAATGAFTTDFGSGVLVLAAVLAFAGIIWIFGRHFESRFTRSVDSVPTL